MVYGFGFNALQQRPRILLYAANSKTPNTQGEKLTAHLSNSWNPGWFNIHNAQFWSFYLILMLLKKQKHYPLVI
jgi:hypothetical protein